MAIVGLLKVKSAVSGVLIIPGRQAAPQADEQVPDCGRVQVTGRLPAPQQQLEQFRVGKIEQASKQLGVGRIQRLGLPFQKAPDQQIILEQAASRAPP
jgi:hypothetical protein